MPETISVSFSSTALKSCIFFKLTWTHFFNPYS